MYSRLTQGQISAYLSRIGFSATADASYETLAQLMSCHCLSVPFENLDVYCLGLEPELTCDALFDKIVTRRRGGYCFELNGLFARLLSALGFSVSMCMARIVKGDFLPPPSHEVLTVSAEGKRYFCDVGFGGPAPSSPLELIYGKEHICAAGRIYRFEKRGRLTALQIQKDGAFSDMMLLDETPCDPVDFVPLNAFCAYSPKEPFVHKVMAWKKTDCGKVSIDGDILRTEQNGEMAERKLSKQDFPSVLKEHFGIEL